MATHLSKLELPTPTMLLEPKGTLPAPLEPKEDAIPPTSPRDLAKPPAPLPPLPTATPLDLLPLPPLLLPRVRLQVLQLARTPLDPAELDAHQRPVPTLPDLPTPPETPLKLDAEALRLLLDNNKDPSDEETAALLEMLLRPTLHHNLNNTANTSTLPRRRPV
jgi:hypothetical protein